MITRNSFLFLIAIFFSISLFSLSAQSNETMDRLLEQERAGYGLSAYMVLTSTGALAEDSTAREAVAAIPAEEWSVTPGAADEPITLGEYSYLLMRALDIQGGIMYRLFPGPRYAARELVYLGFVPGEEAPGRFISGSDAVHILGRALEWKEARS